MERPKVFKFKVWYDTKAQRTEGIAITNPQSGNFVGSAIVIADLDKQLPPLTNPKPSVQIRRADLIVYPNEKKKKGEITIRKKKKLVKK